MKIDRKTERERKRNIVYNAAAKQFYNLGYEKASISDISRETGLTKAGLYYYFKSKEDLLFQILNGFMDHMLDEIKLIKENYNDPVELIKECIRFEIIVYSRDKYRSELLLFQVKCLTGKYYQELVDKQREYVSYWKEGLSEYCRQEKIKIENPSIYTHLLLGMCNWHYKWYRASGEISQEDLANYIFDIFFNGFKSQLIKTSQKKK